MDFAAFLERVQESKGYHDQIVYVHRIPKREAAYCTLSEPLQPELTSALDKMGITNLYTHQVEAIKSMRAGHNIVVVTSTASGKTLCYNLPVLETLLAASPSTSSRQRRQQPAASEPEIRNPQSAIRNATALYLFPTKALAQDQLRGLRRYAELEPALARIMKVGTYDGDTPQSTRRKLRDGSSIILTNPDMLHKGILPYHSRWSRFFADLRYVVIDEIHTYRGIFGSNVANVIRRLNRICRYYGTTPQFICSSATIANPVELAERLIGVPTTLVDNDGSPRGAKQFVLWNPPCVDVGGMDRRSSNVEAQQLMVELIRSGAQTITFGRARIVAELMYKYVKESLQRLSPSLAHKIRAYRGGYLPEERREIERQLFSGELLGVTSTNALELGIDVGGLDASIIIGFPGTIASTWQQAGRAGRGAEESLAVLVAYNDPIDQYLMRRPDYFFGRSPEHAIVDPDNPYILANHMRCAAFELPIKEEDSASFGRQMPQLAEILEEAGDFKRIDKTWYWSKTDYPAADVNLRTISENTFTIVDTSHENRVIGAVDAISAPELVYPEAVYMHEAETYFVEDLDLQNKVAYVRPANVDYYTQAVLDASIRIAEPGTPHTGSSLSHHVSGDEREREGVRADSETRPPHPSPLPAAGEGKPETPPADDAAAPSPNVGRGVAEGRGEGQSRITLHGSKVCLGPATITWATTGFKKIKFYSLDSIGWGKVDIPPQHLETMALWIIPPAELLAEVRKHGRNPVEGLVGIRNLAVHVLPLFAMCDKQDIGGIVDSSNTGSPTIFIYDRYTGGLGFAEKGYEMVEDVMQSCLEMALECPCEDGCPSCVGLPVLRPPIHTDPDSMGGFPIPDKEAARIVLRAIVQ